LRKRNPYIIPIAILAVLGLICLVLVKPSIEQNRKSREFLNELLTAVRDVRNGDTSTLADKYQPYPLNDAYVGALKKYLLIGWDIQSIDCQPYPMESGVKDVTGKVNLYYQGLPAYLLQPQGKYPEVTDPRFGKCALVSVKVHFYFDAQKQRFRLKDADLHTGAEMLCPFDPSALPKYYLNPNKH